MNSFVYFVLIIYVPNLKELRRVAVKHDVNQLPDSFYTLENWGDNAEFLLSLVPPPWSYPENVLVDVQEIDSIVTPEEAT